jgi:hypothetical protein
MKNQSMFPYRRSGGKKRGKGGPGRRHHDGGGGGGGRRVPGSAAELLPMLQPATKALAQMLAGNTRMSGQLVHARNVLAQANRLVEERMPDRLPPAAREAFFEQLALLKLTITDAEEAGLAPEPTSEVQVRPVEEMGADRLREVALRLAAASAESSQRPLTPPLRFHEEQEEPEPSVADRETVPVGEIHEETGSRLRRPAAAEGQTFRPQDSGPRRERLRLKPGRQASADPEG